MIEREIDIETRDGQVNTFITHPEEGGPHPLVIIYMDAPGKREELHDYARRIATVGYYVMLPNLYYREVREFNLYMPGATRERLMELMATLSNAMVVEDTRSLLAHAEADGACNAKRFAGVGYCMSGPFVFAAANAFPHRMTAAASIHGVKLFTDAPDSPHLKAEEATAELYFGCAETDDWAPPEMVSALDEHLASVGANFRIEWYPGTHHGFVFPQRDGIYVKDASERHWERLFDLFGRNLAS